MSKDPQANLMIDLDWLFCVNGVHSIFMPFANYDAYVFIVRVFSNKQ